MDRRISLKEDYNFKNTIIITLNVIVLSIPGNEGL
jgi:hypothetical protein